MTRKSVAGTSLQMHPQVPPGTEGNPPTVGRYTARIAAFRADKLRFIAIGVFPIVIDYAPVFAAYEEEAAIERAIAESFGGRTAMLAYVEAQTAEQLGMDASEMSAYLNAAAKIAE